jgi:hypothetical protein
MRKAGFSPALTIEEKEEKKTTFTGQNKSQSRRIMFSSTGLSLSD